ncbi:hypothetical protein HMPREF0682_2661 [Propionibacterium acidifaciens F0233]|uniref:Uncharacterized protein n=1 Tax=Propionibacterium acidifaciens F0233 TaxID=553198 RepID=U2QDB8_9ACTN|nr:hypothetical protein HMPREF0682_2661 [Propionibacterium acidifaciens F0233]
MARLDGPGLSGRDASGCQPLPGSGNCRQCRAGAAPHRQSRGSHRFADDSVPTG